MSYQILKFKEEMKQGLLNYPINELDEEYFSEHGKPPSGKYAKMLTRATPIADKVWKQSLTVKAKLHDMQFLLDYPITNRAFECLVENYAAFDIELQDFNKLLKTTKQEKPLEDYYQRFESLYTVNVFEMLSDDLESLIPVGMEMNSQERQRYDIPELTVVLDELKAYYKPCLKKAKEDKAKIAKNAQQAKAK